MILSPIIICDLSIENLFISQFCERDKKMESYKKFENKISAFLKKKNIIITPQRYLVDVLSKMAQAVFASLVIGLIFKTIGEQGQVLFGSQPFLQYLINVGGFVMEIVARPLV